MQREEGKGTKCANRVAANGKLQAKKETKISEWKKLNRETDEPLKTV